MMIAALCALATGAIAGLFLAIRHFMRKRLPVGVAVAHGLGGATGFTLLLLAVVRESSFQPARQALYLLIATVVLGAVNLLFHIRGKRHRTSLIVMHALCAVSGVSTLVYGIAVHDAQAAVPATSTPHPALPPSPPIAVAVPEHPQNIQQQAPPDAPNPAVAVAVPEHPQNIQQQAPPDAPNPAVAPAAVQPAANGAPLIADSSLHEALTRTIHFETSSARIMPESAPVVEEIATILKQHPEVRLVQVQGHADERGFNSENLTLTRHRAAAVVDALVSRGVARERLHSAGYGASCPADVACQADDAPASCHAEERYQENRRVVFLPLRVGDDAYRGEIVCPHGAAFIPAEDRAFLAPRR